MASKRQQQYNSCSATNLTRRQWRVIQILRTLWDTPYMSDFTPTPTSSSHMTGDSHYSMEETLSEKTILTWSIPERDFKYRLDFGRESLHENILLDLL